MDYAALSQIIRVQHLGIFGGFHPRPEDCAPEGTGTLLLLGPDEPGFWAHVTSEPEFADGKPDPMDRWSRRVIGHLACDLGAKAQFPFGGPPYAPFIRWAGRTGRAWVSPVSILVHDTAGLMLSYRGALALTEQIDLPEPPPPPCETCAKPCLTACPVNALTSDGYDTDTCHRYLDTAPGTACMTRGCDVRRACPVSQSYDRLPEQSAFHMRSFHP
ncbi:ferredoxin [Rhodophyticola sp. CCM32]|uniref:ferredoxin n=1 Tax=Rhodophyticola sp. CCM32 TaxID=2916397 RepID=UPI00107F6400|nr:ferredoxin [Rhodophyticola sp. CCM32]QBY02386.1 ferredoxin [Rhodophyticola sp. CCM32]